MHAFLFKNHHVPKPEPSQNTAYLKMASTCSKSQLSLSLLFLLFLVAEHAMTVGAVDACDVVVKPLTPCHGAFSSRNGSHTPSTKCCRGAALVAEENDGTPSGSMIVCVCLKALMAQFQLIRPQAVRNVFGKCNVTVPVPEPSTNCLPAITLRYSSYVLEAG